jgi:site-specific recombinase XerC
MSLLAPTLQAFFTDRLLTQRQASPRTVAAYRDTLRLLLGFAQQRIGTPRSGSTSPTSTPSWSRRS